MARVIKSAGGPRSAGSTVSANRPKPGAPQRKNESQSQRSVQGPKATGKPGATRVVNGPKTSSSLKKSTFKKLTRDEQKLNMDVDVTALTLKYISPLSAGKVGFFLSIAFGVILVIMVSVFWLFLDTSGIIFQFAQALTSSGLGIDLSGTFAIGKVILVTSLLACVNVALITILSVLIALIYNAAAKLSGGLKLYFTR
ncbi:MAG: DUF3566 domain-containing protein [Candidatus Ancillula sp.]|jgi:hypothetical protein|nr:DUF3566 domain-containing protein [Candidatus Ancillula sp.]